MTGEPITDSRSSVRSVDRDEATRALRLSAVLVLGIMLMALSAIVTIRRRLLWANGLFYSQFVGIELPGIIIIAAFAVAILRLSGRRSGAIAVPEWRPSRSMWTVAWIAAA